MSPPLFLNLVGVRCVELLLKFLVLLFFANHFVARGGSWNYELLEILLSVYVEATPELYFSNVEIKDDLLPMQRLIH
jgi:hypothetical protein